MILEPDQPPRQLSVVAPSTMMGRAVSDDNAEQLDQQRFREGRTRKSAAFLRFGLPFHPKTAEEIRHEHRHPSVRRADGNHRAPADRVRPRRRRVLCGTTAASAISTSCRAGRSIASAIRRQSSPKRSPRRPKLLLTPSPAFYNGPSLKLAKALVDHSCFDQVFFANSGAEANEGAIKLARKYGALHKNGALRDHHLRRRLPWPDAGDHVGLRQEGLRAAVRAQGVRLSARHS